MGDMADWHMEEMMLEDFREELERRDIDEKLKELEEYYKLGILRWVTKEGEQILLQKMTDEHVMNTIEFLKKKDKSEIRNKWIQLLGYEFEKRI